MYTGLMTGFKKHLRITGTDLDDQLDICLKASINSAEQFVGVCLVKSTIVEDVPFAERTKLPRPLIGVSQVTLIVERGGVYNGIVLLPTEYKVEGSYLVITDSSLTGDSLTITMTVGRSIMEDDIKAAIYLRAAKLFNNPADSVETMINASDNLLAPHRQIDGE